jgi:N-acetylglucosamine-6-phosphate deacetylase
MDYGQGIIKIMTLAPEMFDDEGLQYLIQTGILLIAGHSNATYDQALRGIKSGVKGVTHLYNAMSPLGSREPGLVGACLDHAHFASIIPDGIHVSFPSLRIAKRIMGNRLFLISDSVTETDKGPYKFNLGDQRYVDDQGTLSGSAISLMQGVENCVRKVGISLAEALRMGSTFPAKVLGQDPITGTLHPGNLADFIVFNSDFKLQHVFYEGKNRLSPSFTF